MLEDEIIQGRPGLARRLLLRLVWRHRRTGIVLFALAIAQTALAAASPWLVGIAIDSGIPAARQSDIRPLAGIGLTLVLCAVGVAVLNRMWRKRAGEIGQLVVLDLRSELFAKLQRLSVEFHERLSSGRIITRLTSDVEAVNALFGATLTGLMQALLAIVVTIAAMLLLDAGLAAVIFGALAPLALLTVWTIRRLRIAYGGNRAAVADAAVHVVESLNGIRTVHAFRRHHRNDESFAHIVDRMRGSGRQIQIARGIYWPTIELVFGLTALVVVVIGGMRVLDGGLEIGILAAFILYVAQFFEPITSISYFLDTLQSALTALAKIAEVIEEVPSVAESQNPVALPKPVQGEVVFDRVQFAYAAPPKVDHGIQTAIPELTLRLVPGQVVAMLGATGAGKSTIAKLIARFYDPAAGRILLDGIDLRDLADRDLRRAVTMLTQEGFLFAGSVADNIRVSRPSATLAEVNFAAQAMGADAFIRALPDGYDTDVRKRGSRLSAGQRQMVAFARAFLANPSVLILDEATSALDIPTERAMQAALRTLLSGRTALVIAHRLSTVEIADRVLVVADGRIVDDGAPAELLARGAGEFAALYRDGHGLSLHQLAEKLDMAPRQP